MLKALAFCLFSFGWSQQITGYIVSSANGKCVTSINCLDLGCVLGLTDCGNSPNVFSWDPSTGFLRNVNADLCVAPVTVSDESNVNMVVCKSSLPGYKWERPPGEIRFRSLLNPSLCLGTKTAISVGLYQCDDSSSQTWTISPEGSLDGKGGLSGGSVFLILLLCAVVVYLGVGCFLQRRKGLSGWEAVPQSSFWKDLPALVKEGCTYSVARLRHLTSKTS